MEVGCERRWGVCGGERRWDVGVEGSFPPE